MQRQRVLVLGSGDLGQQTRAGVALRKGLFRQRCGFDTRLAALAGVFPARVHQYADGGRDDIELFAGGFANGAELTAAGTDLFGLGQIVFDPHPRQVGRQRFAPGPCRALAGDGFGG